MSSQPTSPTSPTTPSRRRKSLRLSHIDDHTVGSPSPYTSGTTLSRTSSRTSQTSYQYASPSTPRPMSSKSSRRQSFQHHHRKSSSRYSIGSNISNVSIEQNDNGLGNLADELEDALEEDYEERGDSFLEGLREGSLEPTGDILQSPDQNHGMYNGGGEDRTRARSRSDLLEAPVQESTTYTTKAERRKSRHQRTESKYDGSDYGPESDQDDDGFPPILSKRIRDIESLTRMSTNTDDMLSEGGGVINRTIHGLKDLGPQAVIENSLSRIITAYTSMATHRLHKTRDLYSQAHSILHGNVFELSEEIIDTLLSDIESLSATIPVSQQQNPLLSLQILASQTLDLADTLQSLTDVLQESRISVNTATRKLKSVRDMVDDMRIEQELTETSMMLIHAGDWDRRCRERQAAATCREVVLGFGDTWGLETEDRPWTRRDRAPVAIS